MDKITFTSKQIEALRELTYIAQKRILGLKGDYNEIVKTNSILCEAQNILSSGEIEESNEVTVVCSECGTHLNSSVFEGEFRVQPCSSCLQDAKDYWKEQRDEEETHNSLNRGLVRDHNRRA